MDERLAKHLYEDNLLGRLKKAQEDIALLQKLSVNSIYDWVLGLFSQIGHTHTYTDVLGASGDNATVPATSTYYISPFGGLTATGGGTAYPINGTLKDFSVLTANAQPASGTLVFTLQIAGVDQSIVITVPVSGGSAVYSDTTHTVNYTGGGIRWKVRNNATGASAQIAGLTMKISDLPTT